MFNKNNFVAILTLAFVLCGISFSVISLCFYVPSKINAGDVIYGTEEWIMNDKGEIIGWRCWKDPCNCCVVFAQE